MTGHDKKGETRRHKGLKDFLSPEQLKEFKEVVDLQERFAGKMEERWKELGKRPEDFEKTLNDPHLSYEQKEKLKADHEMATLKIMKDVRKKVAEEHPNLGGENKKTKKMARGEKQKWIPVR